MSCKSDLQTGATPADIAEANGHSVCKDLLAHTSAGGDVQQPTDDVSCDPEPDIHTRLTVHPY